MANMRRQCKNLKEAKVDASHWVAEEKPAEVNAIIAKWLIEEVKGVWPADWAGKSVL
jgi:soluble epoxide hydrolase/lipid-phosphate phosphatase